MNARRPVQVRGRKKAAPRTGRKAALSQRAGRSAPSAPSEVGPYATVGRDIGGLLGFAPLGERVGGAIGRLFGKGDYQVRSNSLMESYGKPSAGPPPPALFRNGKRGVRVVEREYLGDIRSGTLSGGSSVFTNQSFIINPGLSTTFPWLSKIARQFDQWEPHGIVFEYRSTSSEYNGSSQSLGTVILATDYDVVDSPYLNKVQAENSDYAMSVKSSDCAVHGVECALDERPTPILFTRTANRPSGTDPRLYDLGNFQLCTQGMSVADVTLGELWVSYDITFYKKQINAEDAPENLALFSNTYSPTASTSDYFGTTSNDFKNWGTWDNHAYVTTDKIYLPPYAKKDSVWLFTCNWNASSSNALPTFTPYNCEVIIDDRFEDSSESTTIKAGQIYVNNANAIVYQTPLRVTADGGAYITLSGGTIANVTRCQSYLTQLPSNIPYHLQPIA